MRSTRRRQHDRARGAGTAPDAAAHRLRAAAALRQSAASLRQEQQPQRTGGWQRLEGVSREQVEMWIRTWPDAVNTGVLTRASRPSTPTSSTRTPRAPSRIWCASATKRAARPDAHRAGTKTCLPVSDRGAVQEDRHQLRRPQWWRGREARISRRRPASRRRRNAPRHASALSMVRRRAGRDRPRELAVYPRNRSARTDRARRRSAGRRCKQLRLRVRDARLAVRARRLGQPGNFSGQYQLVADSADPSAGYDDWPS